MPRPPALRWADKLGEQMVQSVEQCQEEKRKRARPYRTYQYSMLDSFKNNTNKGRARLENFQRALRFLFSKGVRLGDQQKRLVDEITTALLPKFFEDDLVSNLKWLRKKFGFDEINDTKSMIFPRRSGKTEGCAIVIAALAVSQPKGNCIMYNLTATQAKEFLQSVFRHLKTFQESDEFRWKMVRKDARQYFEIETRFGISSIKSYASALKGDAKIGSRLGNLVAWWWWRQMGRDIGLLTFFFIFSCYRFLFFSPFFYFITFTPISLVVVVLRATLVVPPSTLRQRLKLVLRPAKPPSTIMRAWPRRHLPVDAQLTQVFLAQAQLQQLTERKFERTQLALLNVTPVNQLAQREPQRNQLTAQETVVHHQV